MINRRDMLGGLGILVGTAGIASIAIETAPPSPLDPVVLDCVVAVERFYPAQMQINDNTRAISLPFATLPCNLYPRGSTDVPDPAALEVVVKELQAGKIELFNQIAHALWDRHRPQDLGYKQVPSLKARRACKSGDAMPDRVVTPKYLIDMDDLDNRAVAVILMSVIDLAAELKIKVRNALDLAVFNGHPAIFFMDYKPLQSWFYRQAYMYEFLFWTTAAGIAGRLRSDKP